MKLFLLTFLLTLMYLVVAYLFPTPTQPPKYNLYDVQQIYNHQMEASR